ncbi:MAG: hypothetical protein QOJ81_2061 [Chloroflexota bacterium]|nr:hypothetical protein [Chloroflexota bacterium]
MTRFIDRGAVFAGWVGLGMALVIDIAFELIIPVQTIVFIGAPLAGIVIGVYANARSERWRPRGKVLLNSIWAGLVTGLGLAILYVIIRLVFIYGDTGALPDGTAINCHTGPECIYLRYVNVGEQAELTSLGITDPASLESALWRELAVSGTGLVLLTLGGAAVGGAARAFGKMPTSLPLPSPSRAD